MINFSLKSKASFFTFFLICSLSQAQDFKKVDSWLKSNLQEIGGRAALMIYKDGKVVYANSLNDLGRRQKMLANVIARRSGKEANIDDFSLTSRQPIASCSKWLSAALVMTFIDDGTLKLNDTVGKYLPVLSKAGKGKITIDQCLSHTTGIKAPPLKESLAEMREVSSMLEAIEKIAALPMEGAPGKVFRYSNTGLQIAGAVIEKISGKSFETLFQQRIAKPLDMKDTDFGKNKVSLPAGGAISTPHDYMNFLVMILNKGLYNGIRVLSVNSIAQMQVNRISPDVKVAYSPAEAGDSGYGFGEWVMQSSTKENLSGSVSSPGLFGSFPWVDNKNKYCAFLMTYYIRPEGRGERYKELKSLVEESLKSKP